MTVNRFPPACARKKIQARWPKFVSFNKSAKHIGIPEKAANNIFLARDPAAPNSPSGRGIIERVGHRINGDLIQVGF